MKWKTVTSGLVTSMSNIFNGPINVLRISLNEAIFPFNFKIELLISTVAEDFFQWNDLIVSMLFYGFKYLEKKWKNNVYRKPYEN